MNYSTQSIEGMVTRKVHRKPMHKLKPLPPLHTILQQEVSIPNTGMQQKENFRPFKREKERYFRSGQNTLTLSEVRASNN